MHVILRNNKNVININFLHEELCVLILYDKNEFYINKLKVIKEMKIYKYHRTIFLSMNTCLFSNYTYMEKYKN